MTTGTGYCSVIKRTKYPNIIWDAVDHWVHAWVDHLVLDAVAHLSDWQLRIGWRQVLEAKEESGHVD
jgi:glycosidase